jgi:hypothetical protein
LLQAATDADGQAFYLTLFRMMAALHDGHAFVTNRDYNPLFAPGIHWDVVEGKVIADEVRGEEGVHAGDLLLSVDRQPALALLHSLEDISPGATPGFVQWRALQRLTVCHDQRTYTAEIQPYGGSALSRVTLHCNQPYEPAKDTRPVKFKQLDEGIFYVDLDQISDAEYANLLPILTRAKGIIYDMRGYPMNLHGPSELFFALDQGANHQCAFPSCSVPQPERVNMTFGPNRPWRIVPKEPYLSARKIFLVNNMVVSYAESIMGIVEHYRIGEILGEPTAGTNGNLNTFPLPGGYRISWTGLKVLKHDGSQHHGIGIHPDILVHRTQAGVAAGHDEFLEHALQQIKSDIAMAR